MSMRSTSGIRICVLALPKGEAREAPAEWQKVYRSVSLLFYKLEFDSPSN